MNKIILVTGTSRGIGAATAEQAAACGYAVCVNYHSDRKAAEAVVGKIRSEGGTAMAVAADVSVEEQIVALFPTVD